MRVRVSRVLGVIRGVTIVALNLLPAGLPAQGAPQELQFREVHLGMEVRIALSVDAAAAAAGARAARAAFDRIAALEDVLSDWRAGSELRRLAAHPGGVWIAVSPALAEVLALALDVARASGGQFDPTIGPLTALWREARRTGRPIADAERAAATARVGHDLVELDAAGHRVRFARDSMRLDLGAVAKGWILDQALAKLRRAGVGAALIEAGGDLALYGAPSGTEGWRIAVPRDEGDTVLVMTAGAVSSSGPGEQSIGRVDGTRESHVMSARTGVGAGDGRTITVVGDRAAVTDALATALTLVAPAEVGPLAARFGVRIIR